MAYSGVSLNKFSTNTQLPQQATDEFADLIDS